MPTTSSNALGMNENITKVTWQSLNLPSTHKSNSMPYPDPSDLSWNAEYTNVLHTTMILHIPTTIEHLCANEHSFHLSLKTEILLTQIQR